MDGDSSPGLYHPAARSEHVGKEFPVHPGIVRDWPT
jgi:hypothetical protein